MTDLLNSFYAGYMTIGIGEGPRKTVEEIDGSKFEPEGLAQKVVEKDFAHGPFEGIGAVVGLPYAVIRKKLSSKK